MERKARFKKGETVYITRKGLIYLSFDRMAKHLKSTNWKKGEKIKNGTELVIINFGYREHAIDNDNYSDPYIGKTVPIYLARDKSGGEYLIEESGFGGWFSNELKKLETANKKIGWLDSIWTCSK